MDKMERRKVQLDNQPVDFTSFLANLENLTALQAQQKGMRFNLELRCHYRIRSLPTDAFTADPVKHHQ